MNHDPQKHHRRSIRLKGYDYSQHGAYFVTVCTQNRATLFGAVVDHRMMLNEAGHIAQQCWLDIPNHFPNVFLDEFVFMPNHNHGIIFIIGGDETVGANVGANVGAKNFSPLHNNQSNHQTPFRSPSKTIGSIIRGFKIGVTKWFRQNTVGAKDFSPLQSVWQCNYYEHIIRDELELNRIRQYIFENPLKWQDDKYYVDRDIR